MASQTQTDRHGCGRRTLRQPAWSGQQGGLVWVGFLPQAGNCHQLSAGYLLWLVSWCRVSAGKTAIAL